MLKIALLLLTAMYRSAFSMDLAYQLSGPRHAPVVLLLHGAGGNGSSLRRIAGHLQRARYRTLSPSLRGHGESDYRGEDFSVESVVLDIEQLLEKLGIGQVHIVGHSLGGRFAVAFAARLPERVRSVAVLDLGLNSSSKTVAWTQGKRHPSNRMIGASWSENLIPVWSGFTFPKLMVQATLNGFLEDRQLKWILEASSDTKHMYVRAGHGLHHTHSMVVAKCLRRFWNESLGCTDRLIQ